MMDKVRNMLIMLLMLYVNVASAQRYSESSVLADGTIYKIGVASDAIYHLTYDDLVSWGIDPSTLNPKKISVFGNVSGMLPENNSTENYDDLTEMAIVVTGEDDGVFDEDDEIIFYAQSPVVWKYDKEHFYHQTNYYSDTSYIFLKIDNQQCGKRMTTEQPAEGDDFEEVTTFCDHQCHEVDMENHYKMGRKWYGETISGMTQPVMTFPFVFKNAIDSVEGFVYFGFVGSSKSENFSVRFAVNGTPVMDDVYVNKAGESVFGLDMKKEATFSVVDDQQNVSVEIIANNASSLVGLDYIGVNVWRRLRYENEQLVFSFVESVGHNKLNLLKIENSYDDILFLDVTDPLSPAKLDYSLESQTLQFMTQNGPKSYVVARPSDFKKVLSCQRIENQNLHARSDAEFADMLIITDKIFASQAEEIKTIHEETDGLVTAVAFVDEIYNEFSSGSLDVTGIRNYIRMIYRRSGNLKYVLLLGRGSCDYKDILGYSNNFVPPYEAVNSVQQINAYVSDDYFALMHDDEGESLKGKVDLGVGRIPVLTTDEADIAIAKIRRYIDSSKTMRSWRNDMVLISDNERKTYSKNCDVIDKIIDELMPAINVSKIYSDAYERKKNSDGSYSSPDATKEIMEKFSQGALMISYFGHGGVKGLSKSNLLKIDNIINLDNYDRLPFVATATCEFSAFDDPSFVSAGERLFKMNNGGAIAMYTSTRPTQSGQNLEVMKNLYRNILSDDNIHTMRMGDIIKGAKRDSPTNTSNFVSYVFFGDPALKFAYPLKNIEITSVNSRERKDYVVGAMATVTVSGYVADENGSLDTTFNGVVNVKMFDNKSQYTTLNNYNINDNEYTFNCHVDVLFEGKASVEKGLFSISYMIPKDVNLQKGNARLSLYAVDTINDVDANGYCNNIKIEGEASAAVDSKGPDIQLLWNGVEPDGSPVRYNGTLTAVIEDPQGIYHYNALIGRDITLTHVFEDMEKTENVNAYFEPCIDDFTKGYFDVDYQNLKSGIHVFSVSAWDTHGNNNEVSIEINVCGNDEHFSLVNVINSPNPMVDKTCFMFSCEKQEVNFDMTIKIYDLSGRLVNELKHNGLSSECSGVEWDGTDFSGNHLLPGVYVYNVYVKDSEGDEYFTNQKLIVGK